jgi:hypothetical protein
MNRIVTLDEGRLMVVTDLHGDYDVYCRYRDHFFKLHTQGLADILLFGGDLIHNDGPADKDGSLPIMLDLLRLREELGERLIVLLGNHEMPHLYGVTLSRGRSVYTPRFESAMGQQHRNDILAFFDGLPFFVRTRAGVSVAHAGASRAAATAFDVLADYSHAGQLAKVDELLAGQDRDSLRRGITKLAGQSYDELVLENLGRAALAPDRYDDLLRGLYIGAASEAFELLWEALMNKNEREHPPQHYEALLIATLNNLSQGYVPQHTLVAGHINVSGGHAIICDRQLRLASWAHANPHTAGQYLLFDAGKPLSKVEELLEGLGTVFS